MLKLNAIKLLILILCLVAQITWAAPKNVIFFIGDGMGFEQVKAAGMYAYGQEGTLSFEAFPYPAEITTYSANSSVTDSAAAGTALATGIKVNNGVISMASPGDASELYTLLEYFRDRGKSTGLVTTTYMTHATPAAFGAHEPSRSNYSEIATDYLNQTRPNVLYGGGANGLSPASATAAGYTVVTDRAEMQALDTENVTMVSGQFGSSHLPYEYDGDWSSLPHLSEMTTSALAILDNDSDGFFLMIEGGKIDHAGHGNHIQRNVCETVEFSNTLQVAIDWAQGRSDTLIIVTADHETGGLTVLQNNSQGNFPTVSWSSTGHTAANVPVYAWGVNAQLVSGVMDNTDLFGVATADIVYYVKGYVRDSGGTGIGGVTMSLSGNTSNTTTTETDGYYEFVGLPSGNYTVTPSKSDWHFSPSNHTYSPLNEDKDNQDFIGNTFPFVVIQIEPKEGYVPLTVSLDGSQSTSFNGGIISYEWDLGDGTSSQGEETLHTYLSPGEYIVTLRVTDSQGYQGETQTHIIVFEKGFGELPTGCYNNVFNPIKGEEALIIVNLPEQAHVKISLYDTRGNRVRELANKEEEAGAPKYHWDGRNDSGSVVGSGLYFVYIQAGDYKKTKKIVVVK